MWSKPGRHEEVDRARLPLGSTPENCCWYINKAQILPQKHFLSAIVTSFTYWSVVVQRRERISIFYHLLDYCSTIKLLLKLLFCVSLLQNVKTAWNLQTGGRLPLPLHLVSLQLCCCLLKWGNGTGWRGTGRVVEMQQTLTLLRYLLTVSFPISQSSCLFIWLLVSNMHSPRAFL